MGNGTRDRWRPQEPHFAEQRLKNRGRDNSTDTEANGSSAPTAKLTRAPIDMGGKQQETHANGPLAGLRKPSEEEKGRETEPSTVEAAQNLIDVTCGPLLNYKGMSNAGSKAPFWHGSVLIVAKPGQSQPRLRLRFQKIRNKHSSIASEDREDVNGPAATPDSFESSTSHDRCIAGIKLYEDLVKAFWRFSIELPLQDHEASWVYSIENVRKSQSTKNPSSLAHTFFVPSASQSMRIMFHSCNGFSVGTDEDAWSGPALWKDVLRSHEQAPFHVMIGGGDQIYNDSVRVRGPLEPWANIGNPKKRRDFHFDEPLRAATDSYYFANYVEWYSAEPFATANSRIPQINIWDDHDIIDGFGSYTDHFMKCAVFRGIGSVSFKYYCLFQHHIPPPESAFTTSIPHALHNQASDDSSLDQTQTCNTRSGDELREDPSFILGAHPGPYISGRSHSLYMRLGARLAFLGVDARTERTRHQVNYPETYDLIFERVRSELSSAGKGEITHLVVLLGVPIAYPRLIWLETIFTSPIIGPIRFLHKRFGVAGSFFNSFDGQVDLLDDLDDHYTARQHKHERKDLMLRLQVLAQEYSIRITILGGDVHLAAVGRFYSNPKLGIPAEQDHRYMVNVISSAITNKPPPKAVADLLARRNKIHHLDHTTDETLMKLFDKDPGNSNKTANFNRVTMPSRNYAIISESHNPTGSHVPADAALTNGHAVNGDSVHNDAVGRDAGTEVPVTRRKGKANDGHYPLHSGEEGAGTNHPTACGRQEGATAGNLDVCIRVEIDQHDREGKTEGYGFSIPALRLKMTR